MKGLQPPLRPRLNLLVLKVCNSAGKSLWPPLKPQPLVPLPPRQLTPPLQLQPPPLKLQSLVPLPPLPPPLPLWRQLPQHPVQQNNARSSQTPVHSQTRHCSCFVNLRIFHHQAPALCSHQDLGPHLPHQFATADRNQVRVAKRHCPDRFPTVVFCLSW